MKGSQILRTLGAVLLVGAGLGLTAAAPARAAKAKEKTKEKKTWRLIFKHEGHGPKGAWGKGLGYVDFDPDPDTGKVKAEGPLRMKGSFISASKGKMIIEGKMDAKTFTFRPYCRLMIMTHGQWVPLRLLARPGTATEAITLERRDGAEETGSSAGPWGRGKGMWKLTHAPEKWRVTIEQWNDVVFGSFGKLPLRGGLRVHWQRTVELTIDDDKVKKATAENKIVKISPVSVPAGAYTCKSTDATVIGTGTDVEGERYDQVRHTKRFHPDHITEEDREVKEEWEKIKKQKTPAVFPEGPYEVKGEKGEGTLRVTFPRQTGCVVSYHCRLNEKPATQKGRRIKRSTKRDVRETRRYYVTAGRRRTVRLKDGWSSRRRFTTRVAGQGWCESKLGRNLQNRETITVRRVK